MKKAFLIAAVVFISVSVMSVVMLTAAPAAVKTSEVAAAETNVITVSDSGKTSADASKVLESRFLNMLNHNFVYNTTFDSVEEMVNASMPALLGYRETEDDSFIAETYVADYIFDMYGIEVEDFSGINAQYDSKEGYVYIIPRGFTKYTHTISSVIANEDGSYTVTTRMTSSAHDSGDITETCTTLFVPNQESSFGFSIIYSNVGGIASAI